jgi:chromosome segregation ATPase
LDAAGFELVPGFLPLGNLKMPKNKNEVNKSPLEVVCSLRTQDEALFKRALSAIIRAAELNLRTAKEYSDSLGIRTTSFHGWLKPTGLTFKQLRSVSIQNLYDFLDKLPDRHSYQLDLYSLNKIITKPTNKKRKMDNSDEELEGSSKASEFGESQSKKQKTSEQSEESIEASMNCEDGEDPMIRNDEQVQEGEFEVSSDAPAKEQEMDGLALIKKGLTGLTEKIKQQAADLQRLTLENTELKETNQLLAKQTKELQELQQQLRAKDAELASLQKTLAEKTAAAEEIEAALKSTRQQKEAEVNLRVSLSTTLSTVETKLTNLINKTITPKKLQAQAVDNTANSDTVIEPDLAKQQQGHRLAFFSANSPPNEQSSQTTTVSSNTF